MTSVKTRAVRAGAEYLVTHPRSRVTRFVVRLAYRRLTRKIGAGVNLEAIPAVRGSRLTTVVGIVAVAGGIVLVVRRLGGGDTPVAAAPPAQAPFPAAAPGAEPPETRDAPPTTPTTSPDSEAPGVTGDDGDAALAARVEATLSADATAQGVQVEASAGVVTLRGPVSDEAAETRFVRDAEQVQGVKAVQSELQHVHGEPGPEAS